MCGALRDMMFKVGVLLAKRAHANISYQRGVAPQTTSTKLRCDVGVVKEALKEMPPDGFGLHLYGFD